MIGGPPKHLDFCLPVAVGPPVRLTVERLHCGTPTVQVTIDDGENYAVQTTFLRPAQARRLGQWLLETAEAMDEGEP